MCLCCSAPLQVKLISVQMEGKIHITTRATQTHTDTHTLAHRSLEHVQRGPHYDRCFRVAGAQPLEWDTVTFLHFLSLSLSKNLTVKSCKQLLAESSHVVCVCVCGFV